MIELGALVGMTADHGMNDKTAADGNANVVYLEDELDARFGEGAVRVIYPIADPFVRHHGALGSFVRVYDKQGVGVAKLMDAAARLPGIELVLDGPSAAECFELPPDREADFVAIAQRHTTIGSRRAEHDLSTVAGHRLRSHRGISEQAVPFIVSTPRSIGSILPSLKAVASEISTFLITCSTARIRGLE